MIGKLGTHGQKVLLSAFTAIASFVAVAPSVVAQTTPLTTTTNQNSQVNPAATWTHPYWSVDTLCSDPACNPVIPILNPNQNSPLNSIYDYYAYSPPLTKFVDPLPTIPIAVPDTTKYNGSDYYELSVEDYKYQFHRDMFAAVLRGYQQTNASANYVYMDATGVTHTVPLNALHKNNLGYLGPQLVNMRNTPARVKLTNNNSITGSGPHTYPDGSTGPSGLQLPVDETMLGAGSGPPVHMAAGILATHQRANTTGVIVATLPSPTYAPFHSTASSYKYHTTGAVHNNSNSVFYHATAEPVVRVGGTTYRGEYVRNSAAAGQPASYVACGPSATPAVAPTAGCAPVTWTINTTCSAAVRSELAQTTSACQQDSYTAGAPCTAVELGFAGNPTACSTTWLKYAQCVGATLNSSDCVTDTWTQYKACTPVELLVPGIASNCVRDVTFSTNALCNAARVKNVALVCSTQKWAINSVCQPYMPLTNNNPFFCRQIAAWAQGDYCTTTQAKDANYQCTSGDYSFDRALLHQHGGNTPWISDGTPHQWTTPVGDTTSPYKRGLSNFNVPDMDCAFNTATNTTPAGCDGVNTYFYTNQNSARMMWYHDHSYGLTRLNVYNGELSLYLLTDAIEQAMLGNTTPLPNQPAPPSSLNNVFKLAGLATDTQTSLPAVGSQTYQPDNRFGNTLGTTLAIQDKTFVWGYDQHPLYGITGTAIGSAASLTNPVTTYYKDTLWTSACGKNPAAPTDGNPLATFAAGTLNAGPFGSKGPCPQDTGSLWFPHVYSSNTDPNTGATVSGGRWDFGPWVYPAATIYSQYLPTVSAVPESFLDTITANGKAYPYMNVPRKPMRFRIINASNERYINLQLYYAVNNSGIASGVTSTGAANPFAFHVDPTTVCNTGGQATPVAAKPADPVAGTPATPANTAYSNCTEVGMILQDGSQKSGAYLVPIPAYIKPPASCSATVQVGCAANADGTPYVVGSNLPVYIPVNTGTWQRFGGVPDPTTQVPFIQIGNEGGFLPNPIVHYNQVVDIETDPRNITLTNVRNNPVANPPTCPNCILPYPGYTLSMGPAERADIIIDFGSVPDGATLILYNDMIAPNPGYDQRYDTFTGDADMTAINGPHQTQPGHGPNTRTIIQFRVDGTIAFNHPDGTTSNTPLPLPANWVEEINPYGIQYTTTDPRPTTSTAPLNVALSAAFKASHVDPVVSASATTTTAPRTTPDGQRLYSDGTPYYIGAIDPPVFMDLTASAVSAGTVAAPCDGSDGNLAGCPTSRLCTYGGNSVCTGGVTEFPTCKINSKNPLNGAIDNSKDPNYRKTCGFPVFTKAIAEDFDPPSGRLNALLGNESTSLEANGQQTYGFPMVEPITERLHEGETQIWQVIHNGVDTHTIHFHLMNLQVIGRIDWAGIPKLPDAEERGWRELVKMQPLETTIVAVRMNRPGQNYDHPANNPQIPFASQIPTNYRVSDVTSAVGETDPAANTAGQQLLLPFLPFGNGISTYANAIEDFSWEYVWHCHLLGHEEADMMRPMVMQLDNNGVAGQPAVPPPAGLQLGIN